MMFCKTHMFLGTLVLLVVTVNWTQSEGDDPNIKRWAAMHGNYDSLGNSDGFVSFREIKRALANTSEEDWHKEIEPHDDGDKLLTIEEFSNWLGSFKKDEL